MIATDFMLMLHALRALDPPAPADSAQAGKPGPHMRGHTQSASAGRLDTGAVSGLAAPLSERVFRYTLSNGESVVIRSIWSRDAGMWLANCDERKRPTGAGMTAAGAADDLMIELEGTI